MGGNIIGIGFNKVPNTKKVMVGKSYGYTSMEAIHHKKEIKSIKLEMNMFTDRFYRYYRHTYLIY